MGRACRLDAVVGVIMGSALYALGSGLIKSTSTVGIEARAVAAPICELAFKSGDE